MELIHVLWVTRIGRLMFHLLWYQYTYKYTFLNNKVKTEIFKFLFAIVSAQLIKHVFSKSPQRFTYTFGENTLFGWDSRNEQYRPWGELRFTLAASIALKYISINNKY